MRIGAADAQRIDRSPAGGGTCWPIAALCHHRKRAFGKLKAAVRGFEVQAGGQMFMPQSLDHLDQAGGPCGGIQMPDIGFHRPDANAATRRFAVNLLQGGKLDRVTDGRAGAMRLNVGNGLRRHTRQRHRFGCCFGLTINGRGQIAGLARPVVVDRGAEDHRLDIIAVGQRVGIAAQDYQSRA